MTYRKITSDERALLDRLLSFHLNEKGEQAIRIEKDLAAVIDSEGSLKFAHSANLAPLEQKKFPVEAQCQDEDGIWIHALLFIVDGRVDELEIYKDDSSSIRRMPKPQDWEVIELSS